MEKVAEKASDGVLVIDDGPPAFVTECAVPLQGTPGVWIVDGGRSGAERESPSQFVRLK
jgi:hypothetical protein